MPSNEPDTKEQAERLSSLRIDREPVPSRRRLWPWVLALFVVIGGGVTTGVWYLRQPEIISVRVEAARAPLNESSTASVLDATGYVTARRAATVSAEITGKVREVLIEEGQSVEAGQVLAYLDDSIQRAELELAEAQLGSARSALSEIRAQLEEARRNLARMRDLASRQLVSAQALDAAEATEATLAARLEAGEENVNVATRVVELRRRQLDVYAIRAPFSGVVIDKNAQPGEMISPISAGGGFTRTGICTIVDMDSVEIEVDVNEAYIQRVKTGQAVSAVLDAYPNSPIPARVIAIVPAADRERATVRVRIGFDERDARILPDMGVKVAFLDAEPASPAQADGSVLVPGAAVRGTDEDRYVLVVEDDRARRRNIGQIQERGDRARIASGLTAGERVIVGGPTGLSDGDPVQIRQ